MTRTANVLFLCTGNACRSQMAEAIVNARVAGWHAVSAGVHPAAQVHPLTLQVLAELGIEHHGEPKPAEVFRGQEFDLVVTVCDAANEECPVWLGNGRKAHVSFTDPAGVEGSEEQRFQAFRRVRDEIASRIPELLGSRAS